MACAGGCTSCCCCGSGEMKDLPDYYCRFYDTIPWPQPSRCTDSTRQKLNWLLAEYNLDSTSLSVDLQADFFPSCSGCQSFFNDEDITCWIEYKDAYPYGYSFQYDNDTEWVIIEESQCTGTRFVPGLGTRDYCSRGQTQARVKYGLENLKVNIARCKIPNEACDDEVEDMDEGECGYLVTATLDVKYRVQIWRWSEQNFAAAGSGTACDGVADFPDVLDPSYDPSVTGIGGNPEVTYYTECITRSRVVKTLKNDPLDPDRIYIELDRLIADQDVDCCKDWPSPNLNFDGGKDPTYNDETFRCSCDSQLPLLVEGDCDDIGCIEIDPNATVTCNTWSIVVKYMAGNKWILSW